MKSKIAFIFCTVLCFFSVSCSVQNLNISVENNSTNSHDPQVFYWVNNNTGSEIKNIEWSLNGVYFYTADLPIDGDHLDLFDFVKSDGTRYDYFSVKPIKLKAKCKSGRYSVKFDDIPFDTEGILPNVSEYTSDKEILSWSDEVAVKGTTADGGSVSFAVVFGFKKNDEATPAEFEKNKDVITFYLRRFIIGKYADDFSSKNEDALQSEIKNAVNDTIITAGRVRAVRITSLSIE